MERQEAFACILTCANSRVPSVDIFDQGLGDLLVLRVAGNIVNDQTMGSIEYAVSHLHCPLVMVLGHTGCGVVSAVAGGARLGGHPASLTPPIDAAITNVKGLDSDLVSHASMELAKNMATKIEQSAPYVAGLVKDGKVKVVASFYDWETGAVTIFD